MNKRTPTLNTWVELGDQELDVVVEYEVSPPEPDVNYGGGVDITSVLTRDGTEIVERLSERQIADLVDQVGEVSTDDYYARGDWEYDQRKDREAEDR